MTKCNRFFQYLPKAALLLGMMLSTQTHAQSSASSDASGNSSSQSSEKPIYGSVAERDNALLAAAQPGEIQWIETPNEKVLALYKTGETRKTKGALLILHAPELPQLWPVALDSLRRNLPLYGWVTLAVPLPQQYSLIRPDRDAPANANNDSQSNGSESSSSEATSSVAAAAKAVLPRDQLIGERVEAANTLLNKNGQLNIIVLTDNSVAPAALNTFYKKISKGSKLKDGPIQALILVNLQDQEPLSKEQLSTLFSISELPVMDVFFGADYTAEAESRRIHRAQAMQQNLKDYQQIIVLPENLAMIDDKQSFWLEKIRGFMERKAQGNEINNPSK